MATLKKYNLEGKEVGDVKVDKKFLDAEANGQMVKDYIVALRKNIRQWSANTKGRSEVNHSNKKPHKQKGTGSARQGTFAAPQYKGGGVVFGPKPKFDQHVRINRKERRQAVQSLLAEMIKEKKVVVLEDKAVEIKEPSTKAVAGFLKSVDVQNRRVLFVGDERVPENFFRSTRNLNKSGFVLANNVNGYDVLVAHTIVMTESALKGLQKLLGGKA